MSRIVPHPHFAPETTRASPRDEAHVEATYWSLTQGAQARNSPGGSVKSGRGVAGGLRTGCKGGGADARALRHGRGAFACHIAPRRELGAGARRWSAERRGGATGHRDISEYPTIG